MSDQRRNDIKFLPSRLLLREVSVWQLIIYSLGAFIGMLIVTVGFQFIQDLKSCTGGKNVVETEEFIVLSPRVDGLSFSGNRNILDKALEDLEGEKWVKTATRFTVADFNVTASLEIAGYGMSTALFLEAVPPEFIDTVPAGWSFDPESEDPVVPIILPRDYLALYNFGFAASRGLPKIGENVLTRLPLYLSFSGNGQQRSFKARIAGFTSRLNTIAVPQEVIEWGNSVYGKGSEPSAGRIIAEITVPPTDKKVKDFIDSHQLEIGGDKMSENTVAVILEIILTAIVFIGIIIAGLAIALLFISIFLLLHKTRGVIYKLLCLGYCGSSLSRIYAMLFALVNCIVFMAVVVCVALVRQKFLYLLSQAGLTSDASLLWGISLALGITLLISALCALLFRFSISKIQSS